MKKGGVQSVASKFQGRNGTVAMQKGRDRGGKESGKSWEKVGGGVARVVRYPARGLELSRALLLDKQSNYYNLFVVNYIDIFWV